MPHPAIVSGYEELLEVAEAILFSVPLPPGVLDKYKMIQQEVKGRIHASMSNDRDSFQHSASSPEERALMQEKLSTSKRKNAALQEQLKVLEGQVSDLATKMASLHKHHKASLIDIQEQTRHAVEESHARHLAELEARQKIEVGMAKQTVEDQLAAERTFHASVAEKVAALQAMFPDVYPAVEKSAIQFSSSSSDPLASSLSAALSAHDPRNMHHPNSTSRLALTSFFEHTRRALNTTRHLEEDRAFLRVEAERTRKEIQQHQEWRHAAERALATAERRASDFLADVMSENGSAWKERQELDGKVRELEERRAKRMQRDVGGESSVAPSTITAASNTPSRADPSSLSPPRSSSARLPRTVAFRASALPDAPETMKDERRRPEVEREQEEEEAEEEERKYEPRVAPQPHGRASAHSPALGSVAEESLSTSSGAVDTNDSRNASARK